MIIKADTYLGCGVFDLCVVIWQGIFSLAIKSNTETLVWVIDVFL